MKHLREIIILLLLVALGYAFYVGHGKSQRISELERRDLQHKLAHDSIVKQVNQLTLMVMQVETNRNVLDTENKFLKKLHEHDNARFVRLQNSKPSHLSDSAIMRVWAEVFPALKRPN